MQNITTRWTAPGQGATVAELVSYLATTAEGWTGHPKTQHVELRAWKRLQEVTQLTYRPGTLVFRSSLELLPGGADEIDMDRAGVAIQRVVDFLLRGYEDRQ